MHQKTIKLIGCLCVVIQLSFIKSTIPIQSNDCIVSINAGELFRYAEQTIHELTLQNRIWGLLLELAQAIIELLELDIDDMDEFMNRLINTEKINPLLQKIKPIFKAA